MNPAYVVVGVALLVTAVGDLLWTTLWADGGAGPLSSRLASGTWTALKAAGSERSGLLSVAGPVILAFTLVTWILLIWAGWTLVFAAGEHALVDTINHGPVTWTGRIYFVAYSLFTMGNGDFSPNGGVWQIATALTTASGMMFVTMGVTYILSVLGAVVQKRSVADSVTGIGDRSEEFVLTGWNGEDFHELNSLLNSLGPQVSRLANQHKAYPILHYYYSQQPKESSALAIAILDESLTTLRFGVREEQRPNDVLVTDARSSIQNYLQTLNHAFIQPADEPPPSPDLDRLRDDGVPTVPDGEFADALDDLDDRRRKLLGVVRADAREWPPVRERN